MGVGRIRWQRVTNRRHARLRLLRENARQATSVERVARACCAGTQTMRYVVAYDVVKPRADGASWFCHVT